MNYVMVIAIVIFNIWMALLIAAFSFSPPTMVVVGVTVLLCSFVSLYLVYKKKISASIILAVGTSPLLLVILFGMLIIGAGSNADRQWNEEVELSGGKIIVVHRSYKSTGLVNLYAGPMTSEIDATLPRGSHIHWVGTLMPSAIDEMENGDIYFVAEANNDKEKSEQTMLGDHSFYAAFKYDTGKWLPVSIYDLPLAINPNLAHGYKELFEKYGHIVFDGSTTLNMALKARNGNLNGNTTIWPLPNWSISFPVNKSDASIVEDTTFVDEGDYAFHFKTVKNIDVDIPIKVEIRSRNGDVLVSKEVLVEKTDTALANKEIYYKYFGRFRLPSGQYQIKVINLVAHPEIADDSITLGIDKENTDDTFCTLFPISRVSILPGTLRSVKNAPCDRPM